MSERDFSDEEFRVLLRLLMVSDPWPLGRMHREIMVRMLNDEAQNRNYDDWVVAYHEMQNE